MGNKYKSNKNLNNMKNFFFIALLALAFCGCQNNNKSQQPSEADIEAMVNETQYAYEFVVSGTTYRLSLDLEEETAQLYVEDAYTPNGKTFYGTCQRNFSKSWVIESRGFNGTNDYSITLNGKRTWWKHTQYIDTRNNFIYLDYDSYKAKNPDYRIAIKPIK